MYTSRMKKVALWILVVVIAVFTIIGMVFSGVFIGMHYGIFNIKGSIASRNKFFLDAAGTSTVATTPCTDPTLTQCDWNQTPEWAVIKAGLIKDEAIIDQVATSTGVSPRMIAAVVIPEQTRFFTSNREIFKSYFEPLKILGSLSQFSLGVSGIKEDTAKAIENHANTPASSFYPGPGMAALVAYDASSSKDVDGTLYNRLADDKNHYYSYLYTALYIKEVEAQWAKAGYDVSHNPESVVTLFNIGFGSSNPNPTPVAGGAVITTGGTDYTYGELGADFYYSNELADIFPKI